MITGLAIHNQINKKAEPIKKEQNVQAFVRLRPFSQYELNQGVTTVPIKVSESSKEIICEYKGGSRQYKFDHVFDQESIQSEVFNIAVRPICDEVLLGFNGTIFVYGQTGTGKTHTMEGKHHSPEDNGIIPRTINYLFQCLEQSGADYNIRASHLEIYKEEIFDLLACNGNENLNKPLGMFDTQKGFKIPELEEIVVNDRQSILNVLAKSCKRRQTAETQYNKQSSRSHCIFSITVHVKETSVGGEDLIKIGKLNLVDLAGSENAEKSGNNDRLREAALINKSLLTLGKVITDLTNNEKHIPYRSSQLTKILQDSLGGKTKTSIIATISPSFINLDETVNTLEYALKAKNIKNTPQINQRMSKNSLLKEQSHEIANLKQLLQAAYDKNGVYLTIDVYESMKKELEDKVNAVSIAENRIEASRIEMNSMRKSFDEQTMLFEEAMNELESSKRQLSETKRWNDHLFSQDNMLRSNLDNAVQDLGKLHDKLEVMKSNENENQKSILDSKEILSKRLTDLNQTLVSKLQAGQNELLDSLTTQLKVVQDQQSKSNQVIGKGIGTLSQLIDSSVLQIQNMTTTTNESSQPLLKLNKESNDLFMKLDKNILQLSDQIKILLTDFESTTTTGSNCNSNSTSFGINDCLKLINEHISKSNLMVNFQNKLIKDYSDSLSNWILKQSQYIGEQKEFQKQLKEKHVANNALWEKKLLAKLSQVVTQFSKNYTDSSSDYYDGLASNYLDHFIEEFKNIDDKSKDSINKLSNSLNDQSEQLSSTLSTNVKSIINQQSNEQEKLNIKVLENIESTKKKIENLTNGCIDLSNRQRKCTNQFNEVFTDFTYSLQSQKDLLDHVKSQQSHVYQILPMVEKSKTSFKDNIDSLSSSLNSRKSIIQQSTNECSNQLKSLISSMPRYLDSAIKVTSKSGETPSKKQFDIPSPIQSTSSSLFNNNTNFIATIATGKENNNPSSSSLKSSVNTLKNSSNGSNMMKVDTPQKPSSLSNSNSDNNVPTPKSVKKSTNLIGTPKSASKNLLQTKQSALIIPNSNPLSATKKQQQQPQSAKKIPLTLESISSSSSSSSNESPFSSPKLVKSKLIHDNTTSTTTTTTQPINNIFSAISSPISSIFKNVQQQQQSIFNNNLNGSINRGGNGSIDFSLLESDSEDDSDNSDTGSRSRNNYLGSNSKKSRASSKKATPSSLSKRVALTPARKLKSSTNTINNTTSSLISSVAGNPLSLNVKKPKPILSFSNNISVKKPTSVLSTPIIHSKPMLFGGGNTVSNRLKSVKTPKLSK